MAQKIQERYPLDRYLLDRYLLDRRFLEGPQLQQSPEPAYNIPFDVCRSATPPQHIPSPKSTHFPTYDVISAHEYLVPKRDLERLIRHCNFYWEDRTTTGHPYPFYRNKLTSANSTTNINFLLPAFNVTPHLSRAWTDRNLILTRLFTSRTKQIHFFETRQKFQRIY